MHGSQRCCGELAELTVDDIWQIAGARKPGGNFYTTLDTLGSQNIPVLLKTTHHLPQTSAVCWLWHRCFVLTNTWLRNWHDIRNVSSFLSSEFIAESTFQYRTRKSDLCCSPNILGQPPGPQERSCRGAAKSLNTALTVEQMKTENARNAWRILLDSFKD